MTKFILRYLLENYEAHSMGLYFYTLILETDFGNVLDFLSNMKMSDFFNIIIIFGPIISPFLTFILAYFLFKITEQRKEKRKLIGLFNKFKNDIETFFIGEFHDKTISSFESVIPFYKSQQEEFMKLGLIIRNSDKDTMFANEHYNTWMKTLITVLNKYYIGVIIGNESKMHIRLQTVMKQKDIRDVKELETMLTEIIAHARMYYGIKINKKLTDLSKYDKTYREIWEEEERNLSKDEKEKIKKKFLQDTENFNKKRNELRSKETNSKD